MLDWAGLILGQIPQCTSQSLSQMQGVCPGVGGGGLGGFEIVHKNGKAPFLIPNPRNIKVIYIAS